MHPCHEYKVGAHKTKKFSYDRQVSVKPGEAKHFDKIDRSKTPKQRIEAVNQHPIKG
jgi:hypothetical protein